MYDPKLRELMVKTVTEHGIVCHNGGAVVVIQGPRFSTKAESKWFTDSGFQIINMTQYPEAYLCHELGMAVVNLSLVTDFDSGIVADTEAVTAHNVLEVFQKNAENARQVVLKFIEALPADLSQFGYRENLQWTRGDGHAQSPFDVRIFE
jgi:5'-methylthioadenosine phosphorylase